MSFKGYVGDGIKAYTTSTRDHCKNSISKWRSSLWIQRSQEIRKPQGIATPWLVKRSRNELYQLPQMTKQSVKEPHLDTRRGSPCQFLEGNSEGEVSQLSSHSYFLSLVSTCLGWRRRLSQSQPPYHSRERKGSPCFPLHTVGFKNVLRLWSCQSFCSVALMPQEKLRPTCFLR